MGQQHETDASEKASKTEVTVSRQMRRGTVSSEWDDNRISQVICELRNIFAYSPTLGK